MDRDLLAYLPVVLAVARRKGFAQAAIELGMSASNVSHAVRTVEGRLGTPLFARTTRSVSLTAEGEVLVAAVAPAIADISASWESVRSRRTGASGLLRINTPRIALPLAVTPVLSEMVRRYPDVTVEVFVDDALTDIVAARFDAGIRLGELIAEDMVAVRLTPPVKVIIVASPRYLAAKGSPARVADLAKHDCVGFRQITGGGIYRWDLNENGRDVQVSVRSAVIINDPLYAVDLALSDIGLVYVFEPVAREHLRVGRLIHVLPEASIEEPGLFLYFPRRASLSPKLRAFIDTARAILRPDAIGPAA
jgi:DNA-binding transcriptional LysR family regulator